MSKLRVYSVMVTIDNWHTQKMYTYGHLQDAWSERPLFNTEEEACSALKVLTEVLGRYSTPESYKKQFRRKGNR